MVFGLKSSKLIEDIKRRGMLPEGQLTFTPEDFLLLANGELQIGIIPLILSLNEEFFVYTKEIPLEANKNNYSIPYRAIGSKLRDIFYKDTQGNLLEMSRVSPDDKSFFQETLNASNFYRIYYVQNDEIILLPQVGQTPVGSLVMSYYLRPNEIVEEDRVGTITSITESGTETTFTLDIFPSHFSSNTLFDFIQGKPNYKTRDYDIEVVSMVSSTKSITFTTEDLPDGIIVGDHLAIAGETMVPQIPVDLHSMLVQRVIARCMEALGDQAGLQSANLKLTEMENKTSPVIDNRVEGSPMKVFNSRSLLRNRRNRIF